MEMASVALVASISAAENALALPLLVDEEAVEAGNATTTMPENQTADGNMTSRTNSTS
jgi:hypothetical protein